MIGWDEVYRIGQLGKPHGVKGEISFSFTDDVWDRAEADYLFVCVDGLIVPFFLEEYRFRTDTVALLKFRGLESINDVQEFSGCEVYFPFSLVPEDDESTLTWQHFVGYRVVDDTTGELGRVKRVDDTTQNVLLELEDGHLLPAAEPFILDADHAGRTLRMSLPEGLLDLG